MTTVDTPLALFLDDDSPRVRESDPVTSHMAADTSNVRESREYVLALMGRLGPVADFELLAAASDSSWSPSRLRTARHELAEAGQVRETGYYHLTPFGRRAAVWEVAS